MIETATSVYIMPAGTVGAAIYYFYKKRRDEKRQYKIIGFLDNVKTGNFLELPLIKPAEADKTISVIVSSFRYGDKFKKQLLQLGFETIIDANEFIKKEDIPEILSISKQYPCLYSTLDLENALNAYLFEQNNSELAVLSKAEIVVTQKCTLRCKDCAALMPYYKKPKDIDIQTITESLDNFFKIACLRELSILGGEPFLYKDLDLVLEQIHKHREKCGEVIIITNGTILPKAKFIESIAKANVMVEISDYGYLNKKESAIFEELKKNGVRCRKRSMKWFKMQTFAKTSWNSNEVNQVFENCQQYCNQIMNGKLFYCSFACHAQEMGAIPNSEENGFDLLSQNLNGKSLLDYCNRQEPLPACRFCTGRNIGFNEPVPVAAQLEGSGILEPPNFLNS